MSGNPTINSSRPCAVLGAGDLVSHLTVDNRLSERQFRFNLFRLNRESGQPHQWFRPSDLRDLIKACQVLSFAIVDEGGIDPEIRNELIQLNSELDGLTQRWSDETNG